VKSKTYVRCHQPRRYRHDLASTHPCGALLWPDQVADHMQDEHGVREGSTETLEDVGNQANLFTCDCGEPAVYTNSRERKCEECRRSESNKKPVWEEGKCIKCYVVTPEDGAMTCGGCLEKHRAIPSMINRPSRAKGAA
jgi:hypothetical protein